MRRYAAKPSTAKDRRARFKALPSGSAKLSEFSERTGRFAQSDARFAELPAGGPASVVVLHSLDAKAAAGVTRYSRELAVALRAAGEDVEELRVRPYEV